MWRPLHFNVYGQRLIVLAAAVGQEQGHLYIPQGAINSCTILFEYSHYIVKPLLRNSYSLPRLTVVHNSVNLLMQLQLPRVRKH